MRYERLESYTDHNGTLGLRFVKCRGFGGMDAGIEGRLLAHDLLEHVNGLESIGSIDDELEALGGVWCVRGNTGLLGNEFYSQHQSIAHDVVNLFEYWRSGVALRKNAPQTRGTNEDIEDILNEGLRFVEPEDKALYRDFMVQARRFMLIGYRKAMKRFRNAVCTYSLFKNLESTLNNMVNEVEHEGQQFILGYDFRANSEYREVYDESIYY